MEFLSITNHKFWLPTYNKNLTRSNKAIKSALDQSYNDVNIIVIDDNSTDDVYSVVKNYKKVQYIKNEKNMGPSYSRNVGIRASNSKYISFLDADDLWCKNKLESSLKVLDSDSSVGMTCGNYRRLMPNGGLTRPFYTGSIDIGFDSLLKVNYVASGSVTMRRDVAERAGLFDERFRVCEDYALWLSVSKFAKIYYIDEVLYLYRVVPNGSSITQASGISVVMDNNCKIIRNEVYDKKYIK